MTFGMSNISWACQQSLNEATNRLGEITPYAKAVRGFYIDAFGEPSQTFTIQNHTFVILDAPGLVDEDYLRAGKNTPFAQWMPIPDGPIAFVKDIASNR